MRKKLKIAHIASEVAPFSKTGGLGDVARSLPKSLHRLGHEILIISPLYGRVISKKEHKLKLIFSNVKLKFKEEEVYVNYWQGELMDSLPIYFVENTKYFSRHKKLYGSSHENKRFYIFNEAALKLLSLLEFSADIVHCHDWQTGLIPYLLKHNYKNSKFFKNTKSVFTIHNLIFQLGHNWWEVPVEDRDYGRSKLPKLDDEKLENINFAKRAILSADIINTVSEQYRTEIMTPRFGQDLHRILRNRSDRLFGIVNGIDYNTYNPEKDDYLIESYNAKSLDKKLNAKRVNKLALQSRVGLSQDALTPMLCTTSRVTQQKGFDLILKIMPNLIHLDIQIVFMGDGSEEYIKPLKKWQKKYPRKIIWLPFDEKMETLLYAASDLFLLPSSHEPCGINQLIAMRYGCIPIVREVGGLYDTVENYNPATGRGNGFSFAREDALDFFAAVSRALENHKHRQAWFHLVIQAMKQSNSWEIPAKKYLKLYRRVRDL